MGTHTCMHIHFPACTDTHSLSLSLHLTHSLALSHIIFAPFLMVCLSVSLLHSSDSDGQRCDMSRNVTLIIITTKRKSLKILLIHPCRSVLNKQKKSETQLSVPTVFQALNKRQKLNQNKIIFSLSFFIVLNHLSVV